jgi:hypothetical protein
VYLSVIKGESNKKKTETGNIFKVSFNSPVPVTCMDLARVSTRALFNSSDSAETKVLGSLRKRES